MATIQLALYFTGSVRNRSLESIRGGSSINAMEGCLLPFQHQPQISNRLGDVFFEPRSCLIDEGFVLWLGLGDPHFYARYAI